MSDPILQGRLLALISSLGLSQKEAAEIIGISHEALSRKLSGKPRYDVQETDIEPLQNLADMVDRNVGSALKTIHTQVQRAPKPLPEIDGIFPIRMVLYRTDEDLPPWAAEYHFASVHRVATSRILSDPLIRKYATGVMFDRESYDRFLDGRKDTTEERAEWAATLPLSRLSLKLASDSLGWALLKETEAHPTSVKRGITKL